MQLEGLGNQYLNSPKYHIQSNLSVYCRSDSLQLLCHVIWLAVCECFFLLCVSEIVLQKYRRRKKHSDPISHSVQLSSFYLRLYFQPPGMCFPAESYLHSICIGKIQTLNQFNRMRVNANIELPLNFHFIIEGAPPTPPRAHETVFQLYTAPKWQTRLQLRRPNLVC